MSPLDQPVAAALLCVFVIAVLGTVAYVVIGCLIERLRR